MICAIQASASVEKIMDWLLKGGLYIVSYNKFYGYANIHDYVVGNFRIGCLLSYKDRKVKALWKVPVYLQPVTLIAMAINRVIEEYAPDTHLYNVSADVTLTIGGIWLVIICITGYINKKKRNN